MAKSNFHAEIQDTDHFMLAARAFLL